MPASSTLAAPLLLADFGSFFVNARIVHSEFPRNPNTELWSGGRTPAEGMYVQYMIPDVPEGALKTPVMMVHGFSHTGKTYETTPDGREGWATYFVRRGHPVYVVDQAGRARSGFDANVFNQAVIENRLDVLPKSLPTFTHKQIWHFCRFGPAPDVWWDNSKFPTGHLDDYLAQIVPNTEVTLKEGGMTNVAAMVSLLDKVGPMIVFVHSQSGIYGAMTAIARPDLVSAFVNVEGTTGCELDESQLDTLAAVPVMVVAGDHGWQGEKVGRAAVSGLKARGGRADYFDLAEQGMPGHTHMLMMDLGNLDIAAKIGDWLDANAK